MSHTPTPWSICKVLTDGGRTVVDAHGRAITFTPCFVGSAAPNIRTAAANSRLIVRAVNAHADLADALGWALDLIEDDLDPMHQQAMAHARAVLAQALGEA